MDKKIKTKKIFLIIGSTFLALIIAFALIACKALGVFDFELKSMINEVKDKYIQVEYSDKELDVSFSYNLFVPENYDNSKEYPLVLFITDSSVVGKDTMASLNQGYGGVIWATKEEQSKHECFVLVPEYSQIIVNDDNEVTSEVEATVNLLHSLETQYSIDPNRLYITGQSMGGMTALYLNKTYPDLFAASLLVACQWGTEGMEVLADSNILYLVAGGDEKASPGQDAIKRLLESAGANITTGTIDATWSDVNINEYVQSALNQNNNLNFFKYEEGTIVKKTWFPMEHMATWREAYKIEALRDWLFLQSK